jgi:hypothetical protein
MASDLDSLSSAQHGVDPASGGTVKAIQHGWLKMGVVAAASALAGGLAAAWFYRKTLAQLRQAENNGHNPDIKTFERCSDEDF